MAAFGAITYIIRQFLIVVWTITEDITHRQSTATVVKISENAVLGPKKRHNMPPLLPQLKKCMRHMTTTKILKKGSVMHALYVTHAV